MEISVISQRQVNIIPYIAENIRICHDREGYFLIHEHGVASEAFCEKALQTIESALTRGHLSVFECVYTEWYVQNISRAATHQIVRHRMASYLQQSQRYCKYEPASAFWENMVTPNLGYLDRIEATNDKTAAHNVIDKTIAQIKLAYETLIQLGVHMEDARCILPQCSPTTIKIGMNLREFLFNFFPLRTAKGAQGEIRQLALGMMLCLKEKYRDDKHFIKFIDEVYYPWLNKRKVIQTEWM